MHIYVYVCMHMYVYVCMYVCIYIYIYIYICIWAASSPEGRPEPFRSRRRWRQAASGSDNPTHARLAPRCTTHPVMSIQSGAFWELAA